MKCTDGIVVDANFPGGNIIVERVEGNTIFLRQDLRDTEGHWFYWYFRVRGVTHRTLTFQFTRGDVIGVYGPAISTDGGANWTWLGRDSMTDAAFRYTFAANADEVRFCVTIPYLEADLQNFLKRYAGDHHLQVSSLCETQRGREVELLHLGRFDGQCDHRVLLTCRHHACESMASYSLEGVMEAVLAETEQGDWLCNHVELLIVPFMDKDGVENGDQGKNRKPHDHNRDYAGKSIYSSVRALRRLIPEWSEGRLRLALDLHCPGIRGSGHEDIYFVGGPSRENWKRIEHFSHILESVQRGPLLFDAKHNLPFGQGWNVSTNPLKSFGQWSAELPGVLIGATLEIPYAHASGKIVTAETARAFGRDVSHALYKFLSYQS